MLSLAVFMQLDDTGKVVSAPSVVYAGVTDNFVSIPFNIIINCYCSIDVPSVYV